MNHIKRLTTLTIDYIKRLYCIAIKIGWTLDLDWADGHLRHGGGLLRLRVQLVLLCTVQRLGGSLKRSSKMSICLKKCELLMKFNIVSGKFDS